MVINKWIIIGASLVLLALVVWMFTSGDITGDVVTGSAVGVHDGGPPIIDDTNEQEIIGEVPHGTRYIGG